MIQKHAYPKTIVIVGVGATGSWLTSFLLQYLHATSTPPSIVLIDGDIVEEKNLRNQKFISADVGRTKVQVLAERYSKLFPELDIQYIPRYLKSKDVLDSATRDLDGERKSAMLIGCVDNLPTRNLMCEWFEKCKNQEIIYIDSGNSTDERDGQLFVTYNCTRYNKSTLYASPRQIFKDITSATDIQSVGCGQLVDERPQIIGTNILAASLILNFLITSLSLLSIDPGIYYFNGAKTIAKPLRLLEKNIF